MIYSVSYFSPLFAVLVVVGQIGPIIVYPTMDYNLDSSKTKSIKQCTSLLYEEIYFAP